MPKAKNSTVSPQKVSTVKKPERVQPDPQNAREHGERNKAMIRESLVEVGPFRSIGLDANNVVRVGNGVFEQAKDLGLKVRIVDALPDELIAVRRKDLKGKKAERAALYDNRAGELSEWNGAVLAELAKNDQAMLEGIFNDNELNQIMAQVGGGGSSGGSGSSGGGGGSYGEDPSNVEFKEYDEKVELEVQYCTCPKCGHKFPK